MAKKRRSKKSLAANLKYEVYGILLITVSIIALSGEATVGRSLSKLFGLFLGKFYFVIALIGIYVGLVVMVKRMWPKGWSNRKTGMLVLVLAFTLWSSIAEIDRKLGDTTLLSGKVILNQLDSDLRGELLTSNPQDLRPLKDKAISGGYVGALQYSVLFTLFGKIGAQLLMLVMIAISIMLITGKSYVELFKTLRTRFARMLKLLAAKWSDYAAERAATQSSRSASTVSAASTVLTSDNTIDDDEEDFALRPAKNKKSLFFSWRQSDKTKATVSHDEWELEDEPLHGEAGRGEEGAAVPHWAEEWDQDWDNEQDGFAAQTAPSTVSSSTAAAVPLPETSASLWPSEQEDLTAKAAQTYAHNDLTDEQEWSEPWRPQETQEQQELVHIEENEEENTEYDAIEQTNEEFEQALQQNDDEYEGPVLDGVRAAGSQLEAAAVSDSNAGSNEANSQAAESKPAISASSVPVVKPYVLPPFTLLSKPSHMVRGGIGSSSMEAKLKLERTLESFGVKAKVLDPVIGPAVTRFEVEPASGVKVSKIVSLTDDIALALAAKDIRMEAPIPGRSAIGIEVPNMEVSIVTMREVMETKEFYDSPSKLSIAFGRDIAGKPIVGNLAKMPHLLVAGATGSGKSVCINGIITSILYKATPDEVKFLMVDPKMVELNVYNGIPHLLAPVVTDPRRASLALKKIVVEMEKRYELFSKSGTRNIEGYNTLMADNPKAVLPYIVVIVDELADLMIVAANDVEDAIARLAQMARAAGIHLIIATQRPSVDVITGVIKANIPSRIAFGVSSQVDSRTILDMVGAEKLLGRGDMLYLPMGTSKPTRVQGAFLSDQEVEALVGYARGQAEAEYKEDLVPEIEEETASSEEVMDELYDQAVQIVVEAKQASVSLLQRRMRIGYTRAARLIDEMEARHIVGPYEGSKPREVLLTVDQLEAGRISS
ncbi:DNA segregation ATPase FtsK/SpoIIIE, S-DNA-T family [Paenibacillus algorifonticola]|uniref:DNA segregation ATPase FtsK/SpoIIIE, S-DNA-T family n=1 Tax=Paenibacillus algorifonticola TaxID=684063 RepID=A0A1I1YEA0_9BACL|nr:DNA translocase FtsK [Paenibacillus algorifonticola]SFE17662.1 DNA segregation ATPase FtsK/SpoIIIE, S-DNA-T family [Paenibacillus algorifonticola]